MDFDMNKSKWAEGCPKINCRNTSCSNGLKYVNIPTSLGDDGKDSKSAPMNGAYCNAIVVYEANGAIYIYSTEGVPIRIKEGDNGS